MTNTVQGLRGAAPPCECNIDRSILMVHEDKTVRTYDAIAGSSVAARVRVLYRHRSRSSGHPESTHNIPGSDF
eukprot:833074-Pyramimonas_sp.AAC.1